MNPQPQSGQGGSGRPRLLDLFCGPGGAGEGYHQAGFEVVGVDHVLQRRNPHRIVYQDVLAFLDDGGAEGFEAVHASPPCQANSALRSLWPDREYPQLIEPVRDRLVTLGVPYVIENVPGAPLRNPCVLCGSMFDLGANGRQLRRHRLFESNVPLFPPRSCEHRGQPVGVYGSGGGKGTIRGYKGTAAEYREATGVWWPSSKKEIAQTIPPAYTRHIGQQLLAHLAEPAQVAA